VVTITANPNAGWYFANWSGGTNSTANPLNVTMNSDLVITGNFLALSTTAGPTNRVSSPNEKSLLAAIALGGWVGVPFNETITLTSPVTITNNVVLDGTGVAATLSGGNAVQLFYVAPGASLTLSNLTLANGNCVVTNGPPEFENNQADGAQGVIRSMGGGAGAASGGAVYSTGVCSASDTTFSGNGAVAGNFPAEPGCGGGIYNDGAMTLNRCLVYGNWTQGGAVGEPLVYVGGAGFGGGIFNAAQLAATNCTIAQNSAMGAPAESEGGETITGNALGGGVYNGANATAVFMNLTIAGNSCSSPLSLAGLGFSSTAHGVAAGSQIANTNGTVRLHNTLVADGTNSNAYGPITDDGYNVCSDGSAALFSGSSYNYTDPQLAPLGNYGGPTLCMALLPTSPAIDSGDLNGCPTTDQRGYIRPSGSRPCIGAYEFGSAISDVPYLNLSVTTSNVMLSFSIFLTNTYYLQSSTNLVTWANVSTTGPFAGGTYVSQPVSKQGLNRCFFRLLLN
jgi:hypothetical protein